MSIEFINFCVLSLAFYFSESNVRASYTQIYLQEI